MDLDNEIGAAFERAVESVSRSERRKRILNQVWFAIGGMELLFIVLTYLLFGTYLVEWALRAFSVVGR